MMIIINSTQSRLSSNSMLRNACFFLRDDLALYEGEKNINGRNNTCLNTHLWRELEKKGHLCTEKKHPSSNDQSIFLFTFVLTFRHKPEETTMRICVYILTRRKENRQFSNLMLPIGHFMM